MAGDHAMLGDDDSSESPHPTHGPDRCLHWTREMLSHETVTAKSPMRSLASELRTDIVSAKAVPALAVGVTSGLGLLVAQIAFGSLIFSGLLAPYSSQGVGLVLFGNFAACLVIALAGGFCGAISGLSPTLVIVMAQIGATTNAEGDARFVTTAGALMIGAVATGVCFLLIGRYRLANLVRFVPYSVAGGFVAGIGVVVCLAAMSLMGADAGWRSIPALVEPSQLWRWAPGAAFGTGLYLAMKRWRHPLILPVSGALAVGATHLLLAVLEISGDEARAAGLLLTGTSEGSLWPAFRPADLARVEWTAIAMQLPGLLTLMLLGLIVVVMNLAGLGMLDEGLVRSRKRLPWSEYAIILLIVGVKSVFGLLEHNLPPSDLAALRIEPDVDRALERDVRTRYRP